MSESTGQWRLETMQLVNWGGFEGHHTVDLSIGNARYHTMRNSRSGGVSISSLRIDILGGRKGIHDVHDDCQFAAQAPVVVQLSTVNPRRWRLWVGLIKFVRHRAHGDEWRRLPVRDGRRSAGRVKH